LSSQFITDSCPVCSGNTFSLWKEVPDWLVSKEVFQIHSCDNCGFKFTANAPNQNDVAPYYDSEEYVEHSDTKKGLIYGLYHWARKLMLNYKYNIIKKLNTGNKLLDVGSGSGYFLNHMKTRNYDVTGVEISEKAVKLCKDNFGISAFSPDDLLSNKLDKNYDLITLWHVFEHVYSYNEYFEIFRNSLNEGGKLIIAMPNYICYEADVYKEYWAAFDTPRHLWHFSPDTFEKFANERGFKLERTHRLPLDPFFNAMVSASYKKKFTFLPITLCIGLLSYLKSLINRDKSSSVIYILSKN
jgi:2-polyprenyl-3-methyl-5-hydroxy-6-metoxy-1,4-benzoquinol methylase